MIHTDERRTLVFLVKEGQILLAMKKRGFGANRWNGIGGKIDAGETLEQALIRECQEEVGVTPLTWHKVAQNHFRGVKKNGVDDWYLHVHVYFCTDWKGEPTETEEMGNPTWFNFGEVPYEHMWQDDEFWLPEVLNGKKLVGNFSFDEEENMTAHEVDIVEELPSEQSKESS